MTARTHEEMQDLVAAWAIDALDDDERAEVEAHLAECPACRAEADDHLAVAAALGNAGEAPPAGLWDKIAAELDESPPPLQLERRRAERRLPPARWLLAAAAVAALVLGLGYQVVDQRQQIDRLESAQHADALSRAATLALADPDAQRVTLASEDGTLEVPAVIDQNGTGYLLADRLPPLDEGRTYQLWGVAPEAVLSLGVLGPEPQLVAFRATGDIAALALTDEAAPGVVASDQPALAVGEITS